MKLSGSLCVLAVLLLGTFYAEGARTTLAGCEAGQGGKDCKPCYPGTFSTGGSFAECKSCDLATNAFCLSMPAPCETKPPCDPTTGKYASMCWVPKADGEMCIVEGDMAGICKDSVCVDVGEGKPIGNTPQRWSAPMPLPPRLPELAGQQPQVLPLGPQQQQQQQQQPQALPTGSTQQKPQAVTAGATQHQQRPQAQPAKPACPSVPMCRSAALPCQRAPPCDAKGRPTSMCWVNKPAGAACSHQGKAGKCSKKGQCMV
ncbi:hypothetical protein COO60DRAFT_1700471 [Scenedesmus sp. NREL 46B-D3]|nr:hypothetical protein COO60DRAFT_1700471 [Scenedesmus sp. NREL 46B-D3]